MRTTTLPTEIITEILIHLPVKSLIRFLTVNKSWYSLIKNPNFVTRHLNKTLISNSDNYIILNRQNCIYISEFNPENIRNSFSFSELHHPFKSIEFEFLGSCNGILCIARMNRNSIFVYNPLTNSYRKLRGKLISRDNESPSEWNYRMLYGLGYDSVTDDYKVFWFYQKCNDFAVELECTVAEVFSFKGNSWKSVEILSENLWFFDDFCTDYYGVYVNEAMYFLVNKEEGFDLRHKLIAKFDFRTDTLLTVECPNYVKLRDCKFRLQLNALDGCLCVLVTYSLYNNSFFATDMQGISALARDDLWMMKDEGWMRVFCISDPQGIGIESCISTVACSKDGSRILLEIDGLKLGWYDLDKGSLELFTNSEQPDYWVYLKFCYISGSLVSLANAKV